ncbi:hypothetical protein BGZ61DRAFT_487842 [Ilyonectria robusta]|uniref:uncharacterized protein n=1 Tax=Ilyonectria robusta TaxID=1079257 RepID=UPI001E8E0C76|nr:uncharacterized protein BGZ61DRAFT_487842 [Ilyonectria robusta]KAH8650446.1 hypothetical protein BGZ61DRAFT_487842 [Ilyonectria robusta]
MQFLKAQYYFLIFINYSTRYFTYNPEVYHDPITFKPERFLKTEDLSPETDPHKYVFGFGRRICPGRVLADQALFLNISQSLAVFNIEGRAATRGEGSPQLQFTSGVISHSEPFEASIKPRSPHHEGMIRSIEETHPWKKGDGEALKRLERS